MSLNSNTSSNFLEKLKNKAKAAVSISGHIVQIPADCKAFVCPNHSGPNGKPIKVVISFHPREKERTCECGTIYKKVSA